jgi:hypothetical protein
MPMAKFVVLCARVVNVLYAAPLVSGNSGVAVAGSGNAVGLELVVPFESSEFLALASQAGVLVVFQRPYSLQDATRKPSVGASMQDFLDMFYKDREQLANSTPAATSTPKP